MNEHPVLCLGLEDAQMHLTAFMNCARAGDKVQGAPSICLSNSFGHYGVRNLVSMLLPLVFPDSAFFERSLASLMTLLGHIYACTYSILMPTH